MAFPLFPEEVNDVNDFSFFVDPEDRAQPALLPD